MLKKRLLSIMLSAAMLFGSVSAVRAETDSAENAGTEIKLTAVADTYVSSDSNWKVNFGTGETLLSKRASNNGSSAFDRRTYIKFDFSSYGDITADELTAAKIMLTNAGDAISGFEMYATEWINWEETTFTAETEPFYNVATLSYDFYKNNSDVYTYLGELAIGAGAAATVDLTSYVERLIAKGTKVFTLVIIGEGKNTDLAARQNMQLASKETTLGDAAKPTLVLNTSAIYTDVVASDDTYVRAGGLQKDVYGTEAGLAGKRASDNGAVDADRRTYIKFDLSAYNALSSEDVGLAKISLTNAGGAISGAQIYVSDWVDWEEETFSASVEPFYKASPLSYDFYKNNSSVYTYVGELAAAANATVNVDLTSYVKSLIAKDKYAFTMVIIGEGNSALENRQIFSLASKETTLGDAAKPTLTIKTAEVPTSAYVSKFIASDDTYVRAGGLQKDVYGTEAGLAGKRASDNGAVDADRRTYIKFDMSEYCTVTSDDVVNAKISLTNAGGAISGAQIYVSDWVDWEEETFSASVEPFYKAYPLSYDFYKNNSSVYTYVGELAAAANATVNVDLTSYVKSLIAQDKYTFTMVIIGEGNSAPANRQSFSLASKETTLGDAAKPTLTVKTFREPEAAYMTKLVTNSDTYITGGAYWLENHGAEEMLASKKASDAGNVNADRRTYIKFDMSGYNTIAADELLSAKISLTNAGAAATGAKMYITEWTDWYESSFTAKTEPFYCVTEYTYDFYDNNSDIYTYIGELSIGAKATVSLDVVSYVKSMLAKGVNKFTLVIVGEGNSEPAARQNMQLASKETTLGEAAKPTLTIKTSVVPTLLPTGFAENEITDGKWNFAYTNNGSAAYQFVSIIATYDKDEKTLLDVTVTPESAPVCGTYSKSYKIDTDNNTKVFLWSSISEMKSVAGYKEYTPVQN